MEARKGPNKQKLIFLDIDGVLNHSECRESLWGYDPVCIAQLNRITDITDAKLVLTSTWRLTRKPELIKERLGITGSFVGITSFILDNTRSHVKRGVEIKAWLVKHQEQYPNPIFLILDDDSDMCDLMSNLVQTDEAKGGLTQEIADEVIRRLNG